MPDDSRIRAMNFATCTSSDLSASVKPDKTDHLTSQEALRCRRRENSRSKPRVRRRSGGEEEEKAEFSARRNKTIAPRPGAKALVVGRRIARAKPGPSTLGGETLQPTIAAKDGAPELR